MTSPLSKRAFQGLPATLPPDTLQVFDGYFAALPANTYTIGVTQALTQTLDPGGEATVTYPTARQVVRVEAPEFAIDPAMVETCFPPKGGCDVYDKILPFIVLGDPALAWERRLVPSRSAVPGAPDPTPWLALVVFAEGEIYLQPGTTSAVGTTTVSALLPAQSKLPPDPNVLGPTLPKGWVADEVLASQCQTITITGAAFTAVLPDRAELGYLAHCRAVNSAPEGKGLVAVLLGNRLPVASNKLITRYHAHLVSLEGFADYLGPAGTPLPTKPAPPYGPVDVQLVSLYGWTFSSLPEAGSSFTQLVSDLVSSEQATPSLALPIGDGSSIPPAVLDRLRDGYAPLAFVAGAGDQSFAWYRGPCSPVVPQPLPPVGDPPGPPAAATTADALLIYLATQGLFDASYAVAWNLGRSLALADAQFSQAIQATRLAANRVLGAIAQKGALTHLAGEPDPAALVARDAARRGFARHVGAGLGARWTAALADARIPGRAAPPPPGAARMRRRRRRPVPPHALLAQPEVAAALAQSVEAQVDPVATWLARLRRCEPLPFSYLVPSPAMLPRESIRFFYVDRAWLDALTAGATSIAIHHAGDHATLRALRPGLDRAIRREERAALHRPAAGPPSALPPTVAMTGVLIRSQLVADWPTMVVTATRAGLPVTTIRDDRLAPTVRLCMFDDVPDEVTLAEPYQGLRFGVEDASKVTPRKLTPPADVGEPLPAADAVTATCRPPAAGAVGGVLDVQALVAALATAVGVPDVGAGDFAIQLVQAPESQAFPTPKPARRS